MSAHSLIPDSPAHGFPRRALAFFSQPRVWLTAALALFVIWLRCRALGYSGIWSDQSVTLNLALHWIHGGPFPLIADPSSSGLHNPPLVIYLYVRSRSGCGPIRSPSCG